MNAVCVCVCVCWSQGFMNAKHTLPLSYTPTCSYFSFFLSLFLGDRQWHSGITFLRGMLLVYQNLLDRSYPLSHITTLFVTGPCFSLASPFLRQPLKVERSSVHLSPLIFLKGKQRRPGSPFHLLPRSLHRQTLRWWASLSGFHAVRGSNFAEYSLVCDLQIFFSRFQWHFYTHQQSWFTSNLDYESYRLQLCLVSQYCSTL
jgi:hypothetical protein